MAPLPSSRVITSTFTDSLVLDEVPALSVWKRIEAERRQRERKLDESTRGTTYFPEKSSSDITFARAYVVYHVRNNALFLVFWHFVLASPPDCAVYCEKWSRSIAYTLTLLARSTKKTPTFLPKYKFSCFCHAGDRQRISIFKPQYFNQFPARAANCARAFVTVPLVTTNRVHTRLGLSL